MTVSEQCKQAIDKFHAENNRMPDYLMMSDRYHIQLCKELGNERVIKIHGVKIRYHYTFEGIQAVRGTVKESRP